MKGDGTNKVTQEYIREKLKAAIFLIKSIHQRQRTIYKVTDSIVKHQRDFFDLAHNIGGKGGERGRDPANSQAERSIAPRPLHKTRPCSPAGLPDRSRG